jgi:hypothetical protein
MTRLTLLAAALVLAASAGAAQEGNPPPSDDPMGVLPPVGYGKLTQSDISISIRSNPVEVRFTPLNERLLRLLAPDAYRALRGMVETHQTAIDSVARQAGTSQPGLLMVTFFAQQPDIRFDASSVSVSVRTRHIDPVGIIPLDALFSTQQLPVRGQAMGLYVFSEELPVYEPMTFSYGNITVDDWTRKLRTFDRERARIDSRLRATPQETPPDSLPTADSTAKP